MDIKEPIINARGLQQPIQMQRMREEIAPVELSKKPIADKIKANPEYIPSISEKAIIQAIEEANKKIAGPDKTFEISIHEKTKEIMIKVLNSDTKEVIREIPSEKILEMVASMCEAAGLFIDEKR